MLDDSLKVAYLVDNGHSVNQPKASQDACKFKRLELATLCIPNWFFRQARGREQHFFVSCGMVDVPLIQATLKSPYGLKNFRP